MPETFPADWRDQPCYVVAIPVPLVPYVGGMLKMMERRGFWLSDADYENGYEAVVETEECLMATCLTDLMQLQESQYRMLNTALFGVTYATVSTDPLVVTPAIAPHVTLDIHNQDSLLGRVDRLTQLLDNAINGTDTPLYTLSPSVKALLQSIIDNLGTEETDLGDLAAKLEIIAGLLA